MSAWISNMANYLRTAYTEWTVVLTVGTTNNLALDTGGYITEDVQGALANWVSGFMRRPRTDAVFYSIKPVAGKAAQVLGPMYTINLKFTRSASFNAAALVRTGVGVVEAAYVP